MFDLSFKVNPVILLEIVDAPHNVLSFLHHQGFRPINDGWMTREEQESRHTLKKENISIIVTTNFLDENPRNVRVEIRIYKSENKLNDLFNIATELMNSYSESPP